MEIAVECAEFLTHRTAVLAGKAFAPHNSSGPIANLLSVHLAACIPNFLGLEEIEPETELRDATCTHPLRLQRGHFQLPTEPGFGTDLKLEVLDAAGDAHRFWPQPAANRTEPPRE